MDRGPNNRMYLTGYSGLRPLPPAGDAERWTAPCYRAYHIAWKGGCHD